ncbi:MAG: hypothetical protein AB1782_18795 [Cyanobacteriota bacterium]
MTSLINQGKAEGSRVANLAQQANKGDKQAASTLQNTSIDYASNPGGKASIDKGLAYSKESLKALDKDGNGIINTKEAGALGSLIDLNNDGKISTAENLAYTMYQDASGKMDGILTALERATADTAMLQDPNQARQQMQQLLNGHNLELKSLQFDIRENSEQIKQFQMPNPQLSFIDMCQQISQLEHNIMQRINDFIQSNLLFKQQKH